MSVVSMKKHKISTNKHDSKLIIHYQILHCASIIVEKKGEAGGRVVWHIAMGANNNMIWISTEKAWNAPAAIICNCFFQLLGCIYPTLLRDKDCPACSPHECPASMSRGSQKSLWTRAPVSSIWVDSPADPSKLFYKHATILTERCLVWRGYKKGLKRSHVHLPLSKPAAAGIGARQL